MASVMTNRVAPFAGSRLLTIIATLTLCCLLGFYLVRTAAGATAFAYLLLLILLFRWPSWWPALRDAAGWLLLIAGFMGLTLVSSLWSDEPWQRKSLSFLGYALVTLAFIASAALSLRHAVWFDRWLVRLLPPAAAAAAFVAILYFYWEPPQYGRLLGLGQLRNSVVAGLAFAAAILVALHGILHERGVWRWLLATAMLPLLYALYLTDAVAAMVSLVLAACAQLALRFEMRTGTLLLLLMSLCMAVLAVLAWLILSEAELARRIMPRADSYRLAIWQHYLAQIDWANIWLGQGLHFERSFELEGRFIHHPHSLYLATLLKIGLVGLCWYLVLLLQTARVLLQNRAWPIMHLMLGLLILGSASYLVDGWQIIDRLERSWLLVWLPMAAAAAAWSGSSGAGSAGAGRTPQRA